MIPNARKEGDDIMSLRVITPIELDRLEKSIQALEWQIEHDTNEKDKEIHTKALNDLIARRKAIT